MGEEYAITRSQALVRLGLEPSQADGEDLTLLWMFIGCFGQKAQFAPELVQAVEAIVSCRNSQWLGSQHIDAFIKARKTAFIEPKLNKTADLWQGEGDTSVETHNDDQEEPVESALRVFWDLPFDKTGGDQDWQSSRSDEKQATTMPS
jgi:hypothetical protein